MQEETPSVEEQVQEPEAPKKGKKVPKEKLDEALAQIAKLTADLEHWKTEYYKAYADTQNLRKSLEAEARTAARYRAAGFLSELLPSLDAFNIALQNEPPSPETKNYLIGFQYIYNQIKAALEAEGVKEVAPKVGDEFSLESMHAVDFTETDEVQEGKVIKVYAKGYKLHDRLIRPAMVVVAKAKEQPKEEPQETLRLHLLVQLLPKHQ